MACATVVGLVDFIDELKLLLCIIMLVLLYPAVYHAYQWCHIALIHSHSLLICSISIPVITLYLLFIPDFSMESRILGLEPDRQVKHLQGFLKHGFFPAAIAGEEAGKVIVEFGVFRLLDSHGLVELIHLFYYKV